MRTPAARVAELAAEGVNSVAVALLWSVANPRHERQTAEVVRAALPDAHLALSSDLVPRIGEYERTATVVVDAYIGPLVSSYLAHLEERLQGLCFTGLFVLMRMGGGVLPVDLARRMPVHTLHSGPVGGVAAASKLGVQLGHPNIITTDVGGTSFDVGLVIGSEVLYSSKPMIERQALAIPVVDVTSIGTGGGSIASVDELLGALKVGPASAGAIPGPACYGRGGTRPTVTDAAVILGYIDHLGGQLRLDRQAAAAAVQSDVAGPLGMDTLAAADGILHVACEQMRDLIRRTTIQRGHDPADFVLYAFGGAGPQYAGRYAADLGVAEVVVPALAAEFSAFGAAASELKAAVEQDMAPGDLHDSLDRVNSLLASLEAAARAQLTAAGALAGDLGRPPIVTRTVGLRFYRQIHRIDVAAPPGPLDRRGRHRARRRVPKPLRADRGQRHRPSRGAGRSRHGRSGSLDPCASGPSRLPDPAAMPSRSEPGRPGSQVRRHPAPCSVGTLSAPIRRCTGRRSSSRTRPPWSSTPASPPAWTAGQRTDRVRMSDPPISPDHLRGRPPSPDQHQRGRGGHAEAGLGLADRGRGQRSEHRDHGARTDGLWPAAATSWSRWHPCTSSWPTCSSTIWTTPGSTPDDQFITNDPYVGTLHQPDVVLAAPVFYGRRTGGVVRLGGAPVRCRRPDSGRHHLRRPLDLRRGHPDGADEDRRRRARSARTSSAST